MKLKVVATEVSVVAEPGRFTGRADFGSGLNFVRAENNMGKTTLVMSVLYAMGLEGMLGPGNQMPLKPAVTAEIQDDHGVEHPVLDSWVTTEFENGEGERVTLRRSVAGGSDPRLVTLWEGPALTDPRGGHLSSDFYVRMPGAARRERGLHHRLAEFIGWKLPEVITWDGTSVPLYMEVIAPMLFVEQTRGWSSIAGVVPRYLRIRDPERRDIEFLLGLSGLSRAREREAANALLSELKAEWRGVIEGLSVRASQIGGELEGVPRDPPADWPPTPAPTIRIFEGDAWVSINQVLDSLRSQLREIATEIPRVVDFADQAEAQLRTAEERLGTLAAQLAAANRDMIEQRGEFEALELRIQAVEEDRTRYGDAIRLTSLGATGALALTNSRCPTCDQHLPHTLVGEHARPVMTLEENKQLLDEELKTFKAMRTDAERVYAASRQRLIGKRREIEETRADIRALKTTLTQGAQAPSRALIERQIRLSQRISQLEVMRDELAASDEKLAPIADNVRTTKADLAHLRGGGTTAEDNTRLVALGRSIREQLDSYGFSSWPVDEIDLGPDTYLPQRSGQPLLPGELSASDSVRLVWAYLIGLLEVSRLYETSHPGLLVFDEPGQQEISDASVTAMLRRLSASGLHDQQAIVATSKGMDYLESVLSSISTAPHLNTFDRHVLELVK